MRHDAERFAVSAENVIRCQAKLVAALRGDKLPGDLDPHTNSQIASGADLLFAGWMASRGAIACHPKIPDPAISVFCAALADVLDFVHGRKKARYCGPLGGVVEVTPTAVL